MSSNIFRFKQFSIIQDHAAMKVGTDCDLLGTLAAGGKHILDIGTGTGVLALMMAQRFPDAMVEAVEIDDNAVIDARENFSNSPFADRITLHHTSFQDYIKHLSTNADCPSLHAPSLYREGRGGSLEGRGGSFDCIICNPPYFDKSLECPDEGRTRARHTSSLPFRTLVHGAYDLLEDGGVFTVCIPPEVLEDFKAECLFAGFYLLDEYRIKTVPRKPVKRLILVHQKGKVEAPYVETFCMLNADGSRSEWYLNLMKDFLTI